MKLSTRGRYGLRMMIELAVNYEIQRLSIKTIAERQRISENYLEQIISLLKKDGLVNSTRGAKGGYSLAREPRQISIGEILRSVEGDLAPVDCYLTNKAKECSGSDGCVTKYLWKKISDSINEVVDNMTLYDMAQEQKNLTEGQSVSVD